MNSIYSSELFDKKMNKKTDQCLRIQLLRLTWLNSYTCLITFIQIAFGLYQNYFTCFMNASYILNQLMTFYNIHFFSSKDSYSKEELKFQYSSIRSSIFSVLFMADIAIALIFYNICFVSYDKYEVLFSYFSLVSNIIRLTIVIYSMFIGKDIEIKFG